MVEQQKKAGYNFIKSLSHAQPGKFIRQSLRNPLESIANLKQRTGVMVRGQWLTTSDLQKQLDALAASYEKK